VETAVRSRLHRSESRLRALESRSGVIRGQLAARQRSYQSLWRALESFDLRRRLGRIRTRLVAADGRLAGSSARSRDRARGRLRATAARLDALSPLAVLGRGYAVCWNAERTAVIRDAARVAEGERVRVTLARGELDCHVDRSHNHEHVDRSHD
jgi:exodeoxyribonuclease VII large subunit